MPGLHLRRGDKVVGPYSPDRIKLSIFKTVNMQAV